MKRIELLAPARDFEAAAAAVDYGADALYIGGAKFGARVRAGNTSQTVARVAEYAHRFGVRVYCTLNTLLVDDELAEAEAQARELLEAGADALIVQDMAYRRMELGAELHASTQTGLSTPEEVAFLEGCGFARAILERALSLEEIRAVRAATHIDLECFVHGAICVSRSGRCFLSHALSGGARSGNRGDCSQPCRLAWDLEDAAGRRILAGKHLLSLRDLNLSARLGELLDAGVTSFKVEGRLKDTNYIRNVVACYRRALDEQIARRLDCVRASVGTGTPGFEPDPAKSFTRGHTEYFFAGRRAGVASFDTPKAVGEPLGRVARTGRGFFTLDRPSDVAAGDGLCFLAPGGLAGTNVNRVAEGRIEPNRMEGIVAGAEVHRNYDRRFHALVERSRMRRAIPVRASFTADDQSVAIRFEDVEGVASQVVRAGRFEAAKDAVKMREAIRTQLMRSGDTCFEVREADAGDGARFVPVSLLAELRREGLAELLRRRLARPRMRRVLSENPRVRYPRERIDAAENVTNRLAESFYRDHGVRVIERGFDAGTPTEGRRVMRCAYCIRREIGECLREGSSLGGQLYLVRGGRRFCLEFDCAACEMYLTDTGRPLRR